MIEKTLSGAVRMDSGGKVTVPGRAAMADLQQGKEGRVCPGQGAGPQHLTPMKTMIGTDIKRPVPIIQAIAEHKPLSPFPSCKLNRN